MHITQRQQCTSYRGRNVRYTETAVYIYKGRNVRYTETAVYIIQS